MSYRDVLARKGYQPIQIERTEKLGGDVVLRSWAAPVEHVPGWVRRRDAAGRFARVLV